MSMTPKEEVAYNVIRIHAKSICELLRDFPECSVKEELLNVLRATNDCLTEMLIVTGEGVK